MKPTLKIAAISLDIAWANVEKNIRTVELVLESLRDRARLPDIVALPELFTTGFITDRILLDQASEPSDSPTICRMKDLSAGFGCAITGSISVKEYDKFYNRCFFVKPDGETVYYDKRHLFSLSPENQLYSPGVSLPPVIDYCGWKISQIVCYDMRFPVWCRSIRYSYDVMFVAANWPTARSHAWHTLLAARAIENQAVYVGCDRSGSDDYGIYDGMASIMDGMGMPAFETITDGMPCPVLYSEIDRAQLERCRRRLPTGNDMDDFRIECESI